jgi:small GTP-binding protein
MSCCRSTARQQAVPIEKMPLSDTFNSRVDDMIKVICVGESGIGKTLLILRLAGQPIDITSVATIGVDTYNFKIDIGNHPTKIGKNGKLTIQLWDTAGSERFHSVTRQYFMGAHIAFICFELGDSSSFDKINLWIQKLRESTPHRSEADSLKIFIVGTKADQLTPTMEVARPKDDARYAHLPYYETSAANNTGIEELRRIFYTIGVQQRNHRMDRERQNLADVQALITKEIPSVPLTYQMGPK